MDSYEWQLARDVHQAWRDGVADVQDEQKANDEYAKREKAALDELRARTR